MRRLSGYLARYFAADVGRVYVGLLLVVLLVDLLELLRRSAGKAGVESLALLMMAVLKLPRMVEVLAPFVVLLAGLVTLQRLIRGGEWVACRAAGFSVWQVCAPLVLMAALLGVFRVVVLNPLAAQAQGRYEQYEARYFKGQRDVFGISKGGIWLRQRDESGFTVVHAARMEENTLHEVMVLRLDEQQNLRERLDARQAVLQTGEWALQGVTISRPGDPPQTEDAVALPTQISPAQLQDSFAPPQTISSWQLPGYIALLQEAGFSAKRHVAYGYSLLVSPVWYAGMVLVAVVVAAFAPPRRGAARWMLALGGLSGFLLYFLADVVTALGIAGQVPVFLSVWAVPLCVVFLTSAMLLSREDG